jgi:hypothetical protein
MTCSAIKLFYNDFISSLSEHHNRVKREDGELDHGCTMHVTGMAAIYLSINIRAIVEYWSV